MRLEDAPGLRDGVVITPAMIQSSVSSSAGPTTLFKRSEWASNESLEPSYELKCLQMGDHHDMADSANTSDKCKRRKVLYSLNNHRHRLRLCCTILSWVVLLSLTSFVIWLHLRMEGLRTEKDLLTDKVLKDAQLLASLQYRTGQLVSEKAELDNKLTYGICEIEKLQNTSVVLRTRLNDVSKDLTDKGSTLRTVRDRLIMLGGCDNCLIRDCSDAKVWNALDGVYPIWPRNFTNALYVYCDMSSEGGGWTLIQRRLDGSVKFNRSWQDYRDGFGDLAGELWIGNENLYYLLSQKDYKLRIDLEDWDGNRSFAEYDSFRIESEEDNYRLRLGTYIAGNAGDSMTGGNSTFQIFNRNLNNMQFSTIDRDNDASTKQNCARQYKGGWWYKDCYSANLNGLYYKVGKYGVKGAPSSPVQDGIEWFTWTGWYYSLKAVSMKVKPAAAL